MNNESKLAALILELVDRFGETAVKRQFDMKFGHREFLQIWLYVERYRRKHPNLKTADICIEIAAAGGIIYLKLLPDGALDCRTLQDETTIRSWYREAKRLIRTDETLAKGMKDLMRRNTGIAKALRLPLKSLAQGQA